MGILKEFKIRKDHWKENKGTKNSEIQKKKKNYYDIDMSATFFFSFLPDSLFYMERKTYTY